jgi:cbb3-type cytochrome oxidase subunit 3
MIWTLAGLMFFFTYFVGMLGWVFRPGAKVRYQRHACIPLEENDNDGK